MSHPLATQDSCCPNGAGTCETATTRPHYTITSDELAHTVKIGLPGAPKDGVEIALENATLTVAATCNRQLPEGWRPLRQEIRTADYHLELSLPSTIDAAAISASHEDGVLVLTLPIAEVAKPRQIEIG